MLHSALLYPLASAVGAPVYQVNLLVSLLLLYPFAILYRHLPPSPSLKHIYDIGVSILLFGYVNEQWSGLVHILLESMIVYAVMKAVPGPRMPALVMAIVLAYMAYSHVQIMVQHWGVSEYDYTGPQMLLTIKLSSMAYCVYDGTRPVEDLHVAYHKHHAIHELPGLLEYFGYVFQFSGFLTGPSCEFRDYRDFTNTGTFTTNNEGKAFQTVEDKAYVPKGRKTTATIQLLLSVFYLVLFTQLSAPFNEPYLTTDAFAQQPIMYKIYYLMVCMVVVRSKYYAIWGMPDGACALVGLGFNGRDARGRERWDRVSNVLPFAVESSTSIKELLDNWNICTNRWLRYYVYLRWTQPNKRPGLLQTVVTFSVSAFWHGFYLGYYLTFITAAFMLNVGRTLRRLLRPQVLAVQSTSPIVKPVYDLVGWFLTILAIDYAAVPFQLLLVQSSFAGWMNCYWLGHAVIIVFFLVDKLIPPSRVKKE
jgi:lysophospholipid acyltransferase